MTRSQQIANWSIQKIQSFTQAADAEAVAADDDVDDDDADVCYCCLRKFKQNMKKQFRIESSIDLLNTKYSSRFYLVLVDRKEDEKKEEKATTLN